MVEGTLAGIAAGVAALGSSSGTVSSTEPLGSRSGAARSSWTSRSWTWWSRTRVHRLAAVWTSPRSTRSSSAEPSREPSGFLGRGQCLCSPRQQRKGSAHHDRRRRPKGQSADRPGAHPVGIDRVLPGVRPAESIPVSYIPSVIALDGERELHRVQGDRLAIHLEPKGPRVVDIARALRQASEQRLFLQPQE